MTENWLVIEDTFNPTKLHHSETVFTLGNGYLGTRGPRDRPRDMRVR
jgi:trehalose/maltose hydrolase-like predicted phosphorylase